jgi:hypothetical protein
MGQGQSRSVFVMTRPLVSAGAGLVAFMSANDSSLGHWGLLVTEFSEEDLRSKWKSGSQVGWGTYFEVMAGGNDELVDIVVEDFVPSRDIKWQFKYIGSTTVSDEVIREEGTKHTTVSC